jgi:VIT1/CCC1 family predicted Fe2+/Mn2+ transporter
MAAATLIALLIALAIVLRDVDANASNSIVKGIHEGANFFAGAFTGLITFSGHHPKRAITVDWGIALLAYLLVGAVVSRLIAGVGRGGLRFERRHRAVPTH